MVKYFCHDCNDKLLKSIAQVLDHVWIKHGVEVRRESQSVMRSEDAREPKRRTSSERFTGFRCEDCEASFANQKSFLTHLDRIHIWYEKGLTRKRIYFDGILDMKTKDKTKQQRLLARSKRTLPLSKRPYEPRKNAENG